MPPHLVPPVPRPLSDDGSAPDADPPSPAEAADQALAAAARAVADGRYDEAERLGRLAAMLTKLAGPAAAAQTPARTGGSRIRTVEEEDEDEAASAEPPPCTPDACRLQVERAAAYAAAFRVRTELLKMDDVEDITAWAEMMEGLGAPIADEDLRRLVATLKAEGPGQSHGLIDRVMERAPSPFVIDNRGDARSCAPRPGC